MNPQILDDHSYTFLPKMSFDRSYLNDILQRKDKLSAELLRWHENEATFERRSFGQVSMVIFPLYSSLIPFLGFVYQSHVRPMTTPIATLLDLSSVVHKKIPQGIPTPSSMLRALAYATSAPETNQSQSIDLEPSPFSSIANGLTIPPIHVDHVAEAICKVILDDSVEGVVGVGKMRELIGWADKGNDVKSSPSNTS